jgi:AraC-like DNA-binding protein
MQPNKRTFPARLSTAFKITAILFLFVFLCFAAPGQGIVGKQTAHSKPDTAKAAGDTVLTKNKAHPADTSLAKVAGHIADTAKHSVVLKKDTVVVLRAQASPSMDSTVEIAKSEVKAAEKKIPLSAASPEKPPATSSRMPLVYILVFLAAAAIITGTVNILVKQVRQPRFLTTTRLSVMDKEVQKACRYIEKNYSNPELTIKSICADLVTGEAFLEALMERDLGITLDDFITHVRINRARVLLEKDPALSIETAAHQTGFGDAGSFDAAFKKITGTLFEEYSRLRREKA